MEESLFLTRFATKVIIVHRRNEFRASQIMQKRVKENPKIECMYNAEITEILGEEVGHVTGVRIRDIQTGEQSEKMIDGVFAAIGHEPNVGLLKDLVQLTSHGYIQTSPGTTHTSIPGLFACGDVQDARYRQAITAAGSGCMAAMDAEKYLADITQNPT